MRNRLLIAVLGVIVVGITLAGLLGVLDLLSNMKPAVTSGGSTANSKTPGLDNQNTSASGPGLTPPSIKLPSLGNLPTPDGALGSSSMPGIPNGLSSALSVAAVNAAGLSLDISPEGDLPSHIPLFNVTGANNIPLLRSAASSTYDGNLWKIDSGAQNSPYLGERLVPPVVNFSRLTTSQVKVTPLETFKSGTLPMPTSLYPVSVSSSTPLNYFPAEEMFVSQQGLPDSYSFQSINYTFDPAILTKAAVDAQAKYLQLPPTTSERTKQLAQDITSGIPSPYQKAKAIENYLKNNYTYNLDYKPAPAGIDPNDWFLFDGKEGVCSNFNSAFVTLARSVGIPSRLVSGYAITPTSQEQVVYADQAHAWAEVKFKDLNWITFDATGTSPGPVPTKTEITTVSPLIRKGHIFTVQGTVQTLNGQPVDGVPVELFINTLKDTTGVTKIGQGTVTAGSFNIEANVPVQADVGNYQLLAHSLGGIRYQHSWSDPQIKVTTDTEVSLVVPEKVKILEPVLIQGKLLEESGQTISAQKVDVTVGDQPVYHLTTDKDGQFSLNQIFKEPGDFTVKANFSNTDYYLSSSQTSHTEALIPTVLKLQVPPKAAINDPGIIQGTLLELQSGKPVPLQPVQILINGKPLKNPVITDKNGIFKAENAFDDAGIKQIEAKFASVPFFWESQDTAVTEILSASKTPIWLWPVIAVVLIALGVGGYFWFRRQKRKSGANYPVNNPDIPEAVPEPIATDDNHSYGITLSIEFPQIEASLPDVWGLDEDLDVICRLINSEGIPLAAKALDFLIGKNKSIITTDADGIGTLRCTFSKKGQFKLTARYNGEPGIEKASVNRLIRIVDYREEIVDLFNALLDWLPKIGINLAPKATPREIQQNILNSKTNIPEPAIVQVISCFEEADYSLHSLSRNNYRTMYLAQKEIRDHD